MQRKIAKRTNRAEKIELSIDELREITRWAAECASRVLNLFEMAHPTDKRPREAIEISWAFFQSGKRTNAQRKIAMAAYKASLEVASLVAKDAALAACYAAGSSYLHPLADAQQVKHILGSAAHAARATELASPEKNDLAQEVLDWAQQSAPAKVRLVLARFPAAPAGGGRVGELLCTLDVALRSRSGDCNSDD